MIRIENVLGRGLATPFRRLGGKDFASAEGKKLVEASIRQVLGTIQGEIRWRPSFGSSLIRYQHQNVTEEALALIQTVVRDGVDRWDPRVSISDVKIAEDINQRGRVNVYVDWSVVTSGLQGNQVIVGPTTTEVPV